MAVRFDLGSLRVLSPAVPALDRPINNASFGWSHATVSDNGSLLYGERTGRSPSRLVWVDRRGRVEFALPESKAFEHPRVSPDGKQFAVGVRGEGFDVWWGSVEARTLERLTFEPAEDESPLWHPSGKQIAFAATRRGERMTLLQAIGSSEETVVSSHGQWHQHLADWSPDGRFVAMSIAQTTGLPWAMFKVAANSAGRLSVPDAVTAHTEQAAAFSPDGHWLAYASDESGRAEIYVESAARRGQKRQISIEGGAEPLWSRDGRELFFRAGDRMMSVPVERGSTLAFGRPQQVFEGRFDRIEWGERNYDVSPDGQRFLMVRSEISRLGAEISVIINWRRELERAVTQQQRQR
jgi:Tol biopolymer transport system component